MQHFVTRPLSALLRPAIVSAIGLMPSSLSTPQTVTVIGADDALPDANVLYTIQTESSVSADSDYNGINPQDVTVTNNEDGGATVTVIPTPSRSRTPARPPGELLESSTAIFVILLLRHFKFVSESY